MKEFNVSAKVVEYANGELPQELQSLVDKAKSATYRSYAPYSHFNVGAAILLDSGEVITGSNQENAAFPSGTCAERTAAYYAHAAHPHSKFQAIAIAARDAEGKFTKQPLPPCGACRQALLEYEKLAEAPVKVVLVGAESCYLIDSVKSLLPFAFTDF